MTTINRENAQKFRLEIDKVKGLVRERYREFIVEVIQDINEAVVMATPYKTGFLRANWYAQLNSINTVPLAAGGGGVAAMNIVTASMKLGDVYYGINGAPYAWIVEYGSAPHEIKPKTKKALHWVKDGASRFATRVMHPGTRPTAFVRNTVAQAPEIAANVSARMGRGQ